MIKRLKIILIQAILVFIAPAAFAQLDNGQIGVFFSVPEVALVDVEPAFSNSIHFTLLPVAEPGAPVEAFESQDQNLWLNYSSALNTPDKSRVIVAEVANGTVPEGVSIYLQASMYSGSGRGRHGQPVGKVQLGGQPQPVVSGIGSCFTGDGINNGHQLTFSVEVSDYSKIRAGGQSEFTILYTITDN